VCLILQLVSPVLEHHSCPLLRTDVCCTKSDVTVTNNQHFMFLAVKGVTTLPLYAIPFSCEGLSIDYNWDSEIISRVKVVEVGVIVMVMTLPKVFVI